MSSEYTTGHFGKKSSRVLKPPGGGSSDIFGTGASGSAAASSEPSGSGNQHSQPEDTSTKARVFGVSEDSPTTPKKKLSNPSSIFKECKTQAAVSVTKKKKYVPRNPITGEGLDSKIKESPEKENEEKVEKEEDKEDPEVPGQATSVRVRKPPGGPSSGVF